MAMKKEATKIKEILRGAGVNPQRIDALEPVIENVAFIRTKLDAARKEMKNEGVVVEYDNGGGQKGIRENPIFKGYEALWKSYLSGMSLILGELPDEMAAPEGGTAPTNVLEMIRAAKTG